MITIGGGGGTECLNAIGTAGGEPETLFKTEKPFITSQNRHLKKAKLLFYGKSNLDNRRVLNPT